MNTDDIRMTDKLLGCIKSADSISTQREQYLKLSRELIAVSTRLNSYVQQMTVLEYQRQRLHEECLLSVCCSQVSQKLIAEHNSVCDEIEWLKKVMSRYQIHQDELYQKLKAFDVERL